MPRTFEHALSGPRVNDHDTLVRAIARKQLPTAPELANLFTVVENCFQAIQKQPILPPDGAKRFPGGSTQFLEEISSDSWIFVLSFAEDTQDVIATVTIAPGFSTPGTQKQQEDIAQQMEAAGKTGSAYGMDELPVEEGEVRWTVRLLCVRVDLQRRGIADWFMKFAENAIFELVQEANAAPNGPATKLVRFMLSTIEELNGAYYSKRGWLAAKRNKMPPGFVGSEGGFTLIDMYKLVLLPGTGPDASQPALAL
ncbi:hypothetical protein BKA62DRAFT_711591 [Auriculariales sp. MPI-PUGE-AT-0066]|nr:hypothetical protein BKA62DRAFT_711591 [Auriculariales sp. MPI-PUGE-AT-0066]